MNLVCIDTDMYMYVNVNVNVNANVNANVNVNVCKCMRSRCYITFVYDLERRKSKPRPLAAFPPSPRSGPLCQQPPAKARTAAAPTYLHYPSALDAKKGVTGMP